MKCTTAVSELKHVNFQNTYLVCNSEVLVYVKVFLNVILTLIIDTCKNVSRHSSDFLNIFTLVYHMMIYLFNLTAHLIFVYHSEKYL